MNTDGPGVTVGILAFNSAATIRSAIESLTGLAEILVCDGGSTDGTRELAAQLGARVIDQPDSCKDSRGRLTDIANARDYMLGAASNDWVYFLDSDEMATPALVAELAATIARSPRHGAFEVPRLFTLDDRVITCAMVYPTHQLRLVHRDRIVGYEGLVHDRPILRAGETVGRLEAHQLVPQPPFRELARKWHTYLRLEEVKKQHLTRSEWYLEVCQPGLKSVKWYAYRYYRTLSRCRGTRLPARYEVGRLVYEFLVVVYTGRRFVGYRVPTIETAWGK